MADNANLKAIVLAAGKGTRLQSEKFNLPKVMRLANGKPLLGHVLSALDFIAPENTIIVVGYMKEQVISEYEKDGYKFAVQDKQLGTGHAVMATMGELDGYDGDVLVCCGDMPLLTRESYYDLWRTHRDAGADCTVLSGTSEQPLSYGRVARKADGSFRCIIEEKDCTPEELKIDELNSGVYIFNAPKLKEALGALRCNNAQNEYYLTDVPQHLSDGGQRVGICTRELGQEILGVNTPEQLELVERILKERA
jgi:UDP-N-acetylglucosamine diphosphorylase/glucosamine-1-phosphate N-acetyltransferase